MGYIKYFGLYLTSTTMIGMMPYNPTNDIEKATQFSRDTFDGFSRTFPGGQFIPV